MGRILDHTVCIFLAQSCSALAQPAVALCASLCLLCLAGDNSYGQLGDGSTSSRVTTPTVVNGSILSWVAISAGGAHTCGLAAANGEAFCWGEEPCIFEAHWMESLSRAAAFSLLSKGSSAHVRPVVLPKLHVASMLRRR